MKHPLHAVTSKPWLVAPCSFALLLLPGCHDTSADTPNRDAPANDAGATNGSVADGPNAADTGSAPDARPSMDGSVLVDAGPIASSALEIPSLDDERSAYRKWGWTWSKDAEPDAVTEPISNYTVSNIDVHGETEGDDLWTCLMMYRRTGNAVYLKRAQEWARYFKNEYRTSTSYAEDGQLGHDHMYGWGLVTWYEHTCAAPISACDMAALTEAQSLAADVETYWSHRDNDAWPVPGQFSMSYYGLRQGARHLLLATRVAEVTKMPRWIDLRDKLLNLWLQSPDWDPRGMYFVGDWQTDNDVPGAGAGAYASGLRAQSAFQIGILAEAFYQAYRTSGRTELRDRLTAMARFIDQYGLDATYQYTGSWFGVKNGVAWHTYSAGSSVTFWDPNYSISLVDALVMGFKTTGDRSFYDRAKHFFNRGTKGVWGSPTQRDAPDNVAAHFVDTVFDSSSGNFYFAYNKGVLQYAYLLFENGGI